MDERLSKQLGGFGVENLAQDPFLPQTDAQGPSFLDTGACLCALQASPKKEETGLALWQCIGVQTKGVYTTTEGKWFSTKDGGGDFDGAIDDASNPPDLGKTWRWDGEGWAAVAEDSGAFSIYDRGCTGENHTTFSTSYYRAAEQVAAKQVPVDAAPCWRPGAVPVQMQKPDDWISNGCASGFLCKNNTINSLPQYCPPLDVCQMARVSGKQCNMFGENVGMGPFEPILCQKGFYCPSGTEKIKCLAGSYCQPGTAEPTPCAVGSYCPKGAFAQVFWLPFLILLFVNAFVALGLFIYTYRQRFRYSGSQDRLGASVRGQGLSGVKAHITGYKALFDDRAVVKHENDHELAAMNATYMPSQYDQFSGFEAALDFRSSWAPGQYEESGKGTENLNPHLRAFVDSMRKATDAADFGLSFKYADLRFEPKKSPRPVLQNVTGSIDRGKLTAVMGGSGAGKSTFVNVLMGKTRNTGGEVAVNDRPGKLERYKKVIGFVPQDDIVSSDLTVYENIAHSARVRLPASWSASEIDSLVDSVIDCLELSHVRDSLVGSVGQPVISGGQRKRVSIGVELAAAPMAIFLDEPTSGLDAAAASSITRTLKALARLGISVIVIIHQPRAEIFSAFDKLILLGNGQTVYEGSPADAKRYFEGVGFQFPKHSNHGDVVTDIITGNGRDYKTSGDISKEALIDNWASYRTGLVKQEEEAAAAGKGMASSNGQRGKGSNMESMLRKRGARWHRQAWLCLCRAVLQQYRALGAFWAEMGLAALAGVLLGLAQNGSRGILFRGLYNEPYGILSAAVDYVSVPQMALLVAISIGLVAAAPGVRVFSEEMLLHRREAEAGHSRSAYFVAKTASVLPRMLLACLHFTTPHLVLATPIISWGLAFAANLAYFWCIYGLAAVVAAVARREDAPLFATMVALVAGILSGAAPPLAQVKGWGVEWLWRTSPGVWLAEVYFGQLVGPLGRLFNVELAAELTGYHLNWLWRNLLTLFGIGVVYRLVAFGGLVVVHRLRR